jgi:hypothetical protein
MGGWREPSWPNIIGGHSTSLQRCACQRGAGQRVNGLDVVLDLVRELRVRYLRFHGVCTEGVSSHGRNLVVDRGGVPNLLAE